MELAINNINLVMAVVFAVMAVLFSIVSMFLNTRKWRNIENAIDDKKTVFKEFLNDHIFVSKDIALIAKVICVVLSEIFLCIWESVCME